MIGVDKSSPYREVLISLIYWISKDIPLKAEEQVLIVMSLNTEEKIKQWVRWLKPRRVGENGINATAHEITQAAVWIGKGKDPYNR